MSGHWDPKVFFLVPPECSGPPDWKPEILFTMKEIDFYATTFLHQAEQTKIVLSLSSVGGYRGCGKPDSKYLEYIH